MIKFLGKIRTDHVLAVAYWVFVVACMIGVLLAPHPVIAGKIVLDGLIFLVAAFLAWLATGL